jgi:hypothetical protein
MNDPTRIPVLPTGQLSSKVDFLFYTWASSAAGIYHVIWVGENPGLGLLPEPSSDARLAQALLVFRESV